MEQIQKLSQIIQDAKRVVFFGGAGVSTESGIPDFRSEDGLYRQKYRFSPEQILSHTFFVQNPEEFFEFYRDKMIYLDAKPNAAHQKLAQWEKAGKVSAVITQNIDGLHQMAGSKHVLELHGSIHRNTCMNCGAHYSVQDILQSTGIPRCGCGGIVKPDVVLYEESLDEKVLMESIQEIRQADVLLIGGTSLQVYPAAGLIRYFQGDHIVLINKSSTPADNNADLVISGSIGEVLSQVKLS